MHGAPAQNVSTRRNGLTSEARPTGPRPRHIAPRPRRNRDGTLVRLETVSRPRRLDRDHIAVDKSIPSWLGNLGERRKLSWVRGTAPAENDFGAFKPHKTLLMERQLLPWSPESWPPLKIVMRFEARVVLTERRRHWDVQFSLLSTHYMQRFRLTLLSTDHVTNDRATVSPVRVNGMAGLTRCCKKTRAHPAETRFSSDSSRWLPRDEK